MVSQMYSRKIKPRDCFKSTKKFIPFYSIKICLRVLKCWLLVISWFHLAHLVWKYYIFTYGNFREECKHRGHFLRVHLCIDNLSKSTVKVDNSNLEHLCKSLDKQLDNQRLFHLDPYSLKIKKNVNSCYILWSIYQ